MKPLERDVREGRRHTVVRPRDARLSSGKSAAGFTLIELVVTLTVLTILTLSVVPLVKISVRRQREQRLRETLREMRAAIDEFHRDTVGSPCAQQQLGGPPQVSSSSTSEPNNGPITTTTNPTQQQGGLPVDPRSRVVITDCKIFTVDNPDRYPPDLQTLVDGVNVSPRGAPASLGGLGLGNSTKTATEANSAAAQKTKVYLRSIPVDPITGEADWEFRSSYDAADAASWGKENVFDVRSKARGTALNGEKYSDW